MRKIILHRPYGMVAEIFGFHPHHRLREVLIKRCPQNIGDPSSFGVSPLSLISIIALMRHIIRRDGLFCKGNPYIIMCDSDLTDLFEVRAFHASELSRRIRTLLIRVDGPNPPPDTESRPLSVPSRPISIAMELMKVFEGEISWGPEDTLVSRPLLEYEKRISGNSNCILLPKELDELFFPIYSEDYRPRMSFSDVVQRVYDHIDLHSYFRDPANDTIVYLPPSDPLNAAFKMEAVSLSQIPDLLRRLIVVDC